MLLCKIGNGQNDITSAPPTAVVVVALATLSEPGLEVLLDAAIEHAPALATRPIPRSCALPGLALDPHAGPLCRA